MHHRDRLAYFFFQSIHDSQPTENLKMYTNPNKTHKRRRRTKRNEHISALVKAYAEGYKARNKSFQHDSKAKYWYVLHE